MPRIRPGMLCCEIAFSYCMCIDFEVANLTQFWKHNCSTHYVNSCPSSRTMMVLGAKYVLKAYQVLRRRSTHIVFKNKNIDCLKIIIVL